MTLVLVAAGGGERFGARKQFLPVGGIPMMRRAAGAFEAAGVIERAVVASQHPCPDLDDNGLCGSGDLLAKQVGHAHGSELEYSGRAARANQATTKQPIIGWSNSPS